MKSVVWEMSWRYDPVVARLADRHYSRLRPGTPGFVGSGRPLVLRTKDGGAGWVSFWQPNPTHRWKKSWNNSLFRNETSIRASDLIRQAVAITRYCWGEPPEDGFITFVDPNRVRSKSNPGHSYVIAGWRNVGKTPRGLLVFQLSRDRFPDPVVPLNYQSNLEFA